MNHKMLRNWVGAAAACVVGLSATTASAAQFGVQGVPDLSVPACADNGLCALPAAVASARTSFIDLLNNDYRTEEFASPTFPLTGLFNSNASMSGGVLDNVPQSGGTGAFLGRFNTTGGNGVAGTWFESGGNLIELSLGDVGLVQAFGMFLTDLGDNGASMTISLFDGGNLVQAAVPVAPYDPISGQPGALGTENAQVLFFGITSTTAFNRIVININQPPPCSELDPTCESEGGDDTNDYFGIDSLIVGTLRTDDPEPPRVPTPGTLALAGLALLGLRRFRSVR